MQSADIPGDKTGGATVEKTPRGPYYTHDPQWYDARRLLILKARREGDSLGEIGVEWGITRARVWQILKDEHRRRTQG